MTPQDMASAEAPVPTGDKPDGQPSPSDAEILGAACVQATQRAMAHMRQTAQAQGVLPEGM